MNETFRADMTKLQRLLQDRTVPLSVVRARTRRHRSTVYRWMTGESFPDRQTATVLLELYRAQALDYDGIYKAAPAPRPDGAAR